MGERFEILFGEEMENFGADLISNEDIVEDDVDLGLEVLVDLEGREMCGDESSGGFGEEDHGELEEELLFPVALVELLLVEGLE